MDGAGWHQQGGRLQVPRNISILLLPPYNPELNPQENVWQYLRQTTSPTECSIPTTTSSMLVVTPGTS